MIKNVAGLKVCGLYSHMQYHALSMTKLLRAAYHEMTKDNPGHTAGVIFYVFY